MTHNAKYVINPLLFLGLRQLGVKVNDYYFYVSL